MNNAIVNNNQFLLVKSRERYEGAFASLSEGKDSVFIIEESKFKDIRAEQIQNDFRLITFDTELPSALGQVINTMFIKITGTSDYQHLISAHETNHIIVQQNFLNRAKDQLNLLGFKVIEI